MPPSMKMIKGSLLGFILLLGAGATRAQLLDHALGEVIIQFRPEADARRFPETLKELNGRPTQLETIRQLSAPLRAWLFRFDHTTVNEFRFLEYIRNRPEVLLAQFNHIVRQRSTVPDDPLFAQQWNLLNTGQGGGLVNADIDADLAWDIATGGLTADGDTIVVCIIDDGIDVNHEDFGNNLWINHAEIPGNLQDDDLNGYVDDHAGWNILQDNDNISGGFHGTSVAGIVGAKGNNGIGVSGINWNVKLMIVKNNFVTNEASVLEAYSYPLVQRMKYNASNGQQGAFVVATNASWGVDQAFPEDAPIWCSFYDSLGVHGIISCGATANANVNVDEVGDLPTSCPSDYLIAVTNINRMDMKVTQAGYGLTAIDLGAYGEGAYTTSFGNSYGAFGGTSGATPHVAGAVGLLYAAPCPSFIAVAKSDPAAAALMVRQYILDGATPVSSLQGKTVTGGRLNLNNSLQLLMANCGDCQPPTSLAASNITDTQMRISWLANDSITRIDLRWKPEGAAEWTLVENAPNPFFLSGLLACTKYEIQLNTHCGDESLGFSVSRIFKTDGCCEAPAPVIASDITQSGATLTWPPVLAAQAFTVRWRPEGSAVWTEAQTTNTTFSWPDLSACTDYEYQLITLCASGQSDTGQVQNLLTRGCGPCREKQYCNVGTLTATDEWIKRVKIGSIDNVTGANNGYGDFTGGQATVLEQGAAYPVTLEPGFAGQTFNEYFKIWMDLDQNGVFTDDEIVFDPGQTTKVPISGIVPIPADAPLGNIRMRVMMIFQSVPGPCSLFGNIFGEAEDYCVEIVPTSNCAIPPGLDTLSVGSVSAKIRWKKVGPAVEYLVRYRPLATVDWQSIIAQDTVAEINGLSLCTSYEAQVQTLCSQEESLYAGNLPFTTDCASSANEPAGKNFSVEIAPNPFGESLWVTLNWRGKLGQEMVVEMLDISGRAVVTRHFTVSDTQRIELAGQVIPPGLYFLRLKTLEGFYFLGKVVKGK